MRLALLAVLALVTACGSDQPQRTQILRAALAELRGDTAPEEADSPKAQALTRAQVDALGVAMIRMRLAGDTARPIMTGAAENGGYVSYISRFGPMLTLRGTLVTASRGLGHDLLAVATAAGDPLTVPTPPQDWPPAVERVYRFPGPGPSGAGLAVRCRFAFGAQQRLEIVERTFDVVEVREACAGDDEAFTNSHLVDVTDGRIWRSTQWLGPEQGLVEVTVVEPFTDD